MNPDRTRQILTEIRLYGRLNGYPPSRRELAATLKTSTSVINYYLERMQAAGLVEVDWRTARGIRLTRSGNNGR